MDENSKYKLVEFADKWGFFFLNQQFIIWSTRADCNSYFITIYIEPEPIEEKREMKRKKKGKK